MAAIAALTPSAAPQSDSPNHDSPNHRPPHVAKLLEQARQGLLDAEYATQAVERYARAHRAALRAAAAVLATRPRRSARPASAWALLARAVPELAEWSTFFATTSATCAAAEAGAHRLVSDRAADELLRQAGAFVTLAGHAATRTVR